ncbi:membrane protein [gut metagenome]|uniref:Membrane protein n=1 Tax=gut metagenome TaxID=749906 RepID=J9FPM2_9ZZZZ
MAELLLMIYMIPVILVFSFLFKLALWIIINGIRIAWWLVKKSVVLIWKVVVFVVLMVIANLRATGTRNY